MKISSLKKSVIAVFDFDGTITIVDSFNDFLITTQGRGRFGLRVLSTAHLILAYLAGLVENRIPKEALFSAMFAGVDERRLKRLAREYSVQRLPQIVRREAVERIAWHQSQGHEVVIVSASLSDWIEPWARTVGIRTVITTERAVRHGKLTGELRNNCYGRAKVRSFLKHYPNRGGYILYAYADSRSDRPLLSIADFAYFRSLSAQDQTRPVIVTDGLWRKSLSAIRSLGKSGYLLSVMGDTYFTTGFWSRFTSTRVVAPTAKNNSVTFGQQLIRTIKKTKGKKPIILPMEDASLLWCSENRAKLDQLAYLLIPHHKDLVIAEDKGLTMQVATRVGIATPETMYPKNPAELHEIIKSLKGNSYVVKPVRGSGSRGLIYLADHTIIDWQHHWGRYGRLIVQERIDSRGEAKGVSLLFDGQGECKAYFVHKRLQQYPNSGGPSTDRVGIKDDTLVTMSVKLMKSLHWRGIAMIEWKVDPKTKTPKLMEINPRFWGSLELAARSGINFPDLYCRAAMGEVLFKTPHYSSGVRCRWLIPGDVLRYITQQRSERERLVEFLRGLPALCEEWDPQDIPGFVSTLVCSTALAFNPKYWRYIRRG